MTNILYLNKNRRLNIVEEGLLHLFMSFTNLDEYYELWFLQSLLDCVGNKDLNEDFFEYFEYIKHEEYSIVLKNIHCICVERQIDHIIINI